MSDKIRSNFYNIIRSIPAQLIIYELSFQFSSKEASKSDPKQKKIVNF